MYWVSDTCYVLCTWYLTRRKDVAHDSDVGPPSNWPHT